MNQANTTNHVRGEALVSNAAIIEQGLQKLFDLKLLIN